jgi:hypothetical protein
MRKLPDLLNNQYIDGPSDGPKKNPFGPSVGYDPARIDKKPKISNTRVELPAAAYSLDSAEVSACSELLNTPFLL